MDCIKVADLNKEHYKTFDKCRRVYSPDGIAPTVTAGAGSHTTKIIVLEGGINADKNE